MERAERSSVRLRIKPLTFINLLGKKMERAERSSVRLRIKPPTFIILLGKKWREQKEVVLDYV